MATFTITSCNLRWGLSVEDEPFDVDAAVGAFDTDLIALQEVWAPDDGTGGVRRIGEELGYSVHEAAQSASHVHPAPGITADPEKSDGTWGIALLSRLPVRSIRTLELGRLFERWDVAERTAILAEVMVDDRPVLVAAIHLSFVLPNAAVQLRRLRGLLPIGTPSVVVGDCNLWGPVAESLLTGWPARCTDGPGPPPGRTASSTTCSCPRRSGRRRRGSSSRSGRTTSRSGPRSRWPDRPARGRAPRPR